jgi:hypothetical protein
MKKMIDSKKMKRVMTVTLTALMYVSCTGDVDSPVASGGGEEDVPVSFDRSVTRVSGELTTTGNISGMAVFGYVTAGGWTETATPDFMYGQEVTKSGGAWTYSPAKYWPSAASGNKVSFFAVSPAPSGTTGVSVVTAADQAGYPVFAVSPPDSPSSQVDFCVASVMNATVEDVNGDAQGFPTGDVPFTFDHVMTQVNFSAKVTGSYAVDVRVKELVLSNVVGSGELTFTGTSPYFSWGSLSGANASYTLSRDKNEIVDAVLGTDVSALSTDPAGVLCLVPQTAEPRVKLLASFGGSDYEVRSDFPSYAWKPGGHYTYSFAINKDDYNLKEGTVTNFSYTGNQQSFTVPEDGYYKLEAWGARGAVSNDANSDGKGGYSQGVIYLKAGQVIYVYVGGAGVTRVIDLNSDVIPGTWNGGGSSRNNKSSTYVYTQLWGTGGSATDFRLVAGDTNTEWDKPVSINSRILVAGGGGSGGYWIIGLQGGHGGGLQGTDGKSNVTSGQQYAMPTGGSKTQGGLKVNNGSYTNGTNGVFGAGGNGTSSWGDCAGGGGYYGGGYGGNINGGYGMYSGAGGSSFISGMTGCVAIDPTDTTNDPRTQDGDTGIFKTMLNYYTTGFGTSATWVDGEEILFTNCSMIDGADYQWNTGVKAGTAGTMPNPSGGTMTGNAGNGYARITQLTTP